MATADDTGFTFVGAGAGNITRSVYINAFPEWMREAARSSPDKNSLLALTNQCLRLEKTCLVEGSCEAAVQRAQTGGEEQALRDFLALNEYYINVIQQRNTIIFGAGPSGLTLASACPLGEAVVLEKRTEAKYNRRYYILFFRKETVEQMEAFDGLRGIRKAMIAVSRAPWDAPAGTIVPVVRAEDEASTVGFVTRLGDLQDALYIRALHRRGNPTFFESRVDMDKIKKQFPEKNVVDATGGRGRHAIEDGQFGGTVTLSSDLPPEDMQPFLLQPAGTFQGKVQTRYFCVQEPRSETYTYYFGLRLTRVQYQAFRRHPGYLPMLVFDPERYFSMLDDGTIRNVQQNVHIVFITQDGEPEAPGSVIRIGDAKRSVDFFLATGATKGVKDALALAETLSPG
jgi:hypothetical protein